jgi:hypothetical protein
MKKADLDLYTDYLLSSCGFATAKGVSELTQQDQLYQLLIGMARRRGGLFDG